MKKYNTAENIGYTVVVYVILGLVALSSMLIYKGLLWVFGINF
jgi:thiosulfate reductase cytochrome b subunit